MTYEFTREVQFLGVTLIFGPNKDKSSSPKMRPIVGSIQKELVYLRDKRADSY